MKTRQQPTELEYLKEFNTVSLQEPVQVLSLEYSDDQSKILITLDKTCFYPKGGGQDYDQGYISSESGKFRVEEVYLDEDGVVNHIGNFEEGSFTEGEGVLLEVDQERRVLNTRLHSAGHLLDMAVDALGYDWIPGKGAHYPDMSFVEYSGTWDPEKRDETIKDLESKIIELTKDTVDNRIEFMDIDEMSKICRNVPDNIPNNKPSRVVVYGKNFGVPCGGTHVKNLNEVGEVKITRIKKKGGNIRVSYSII